MVLMNILDNDILTKIIYDFDINIGGIRLVCSTWRNITNMYGFIENITLDLHTPFDKFIDMCDKSFLSLKTLTVNYIDDPVLWIPTNWPHTTIFNNCKMGSVYIDPPLSNTHILRIKDYTSIKPLDINWEKLPDLREIYLDVFDCNIEKLKHCSKLENICINIRNSDTKPFPQWLGSFKKLHTIITNIKTNSTYHFVSPTLTICLVPKITNFTAISTLVPKEHLTIDMYISINPYRWMTGWVNE